MEGHLVAGLINRIEIAHVYGFPRIWLILVLRNDPNTRKISYNKTQPVIKALHQIVLDLFVRTAYRVIRYLIPFNRLLSIDVLYNGIL